MPISAGLLHLTTSLETVEKRSFFLRCVETERERAEESKGVSLNLPAIYLLTKCTVCLCDHHSSYSTMESSYCRSVSGIDDCVV